MLIGVMKAVLQRVLVTVLEIVSEMVQKKFLWEISQGHSWVLSRLTEPLLFRYLFLPSASPFLFSLLPSDSLLWNQLQSDPPLLFDLILSDSLPSDLPLLSNPFLSDLPHLNPSLLSNLLPSYPFPDSPLPSNLLPDSPLPSNLLPSESFLQYNHISEVHSVLPTHSHSDQLNEVQDDRIQS